MKLIEILKAVYSKLHTFYYKHKSKRIEIGKKSTLFYKSHIYCLGGRVIIGDNCKIGASRKGYHAGMPFYTTIFVDNDNAILRIGNNSRINGAFIHSQKGITIGEDCVIASGVNIIDSNGHLTNSGNRTIGRDEPQQITVGRNVWIGLNSTILKGTTIGDNSVVAAGSVVKGVFSSNSLISGVPAKSIRTLSI